jgi:hypothetical protein
MSCSRNHCTSAARNGGGAVKVNVGNPLVVRFTEDVMQR